MIADESSQVCKDRIFTVLNEIDLKVDKVKKKGIVFAGLSRAGKSTAYNWTINHPLEAKKEEILRPNIEKNVQVAVSSTGRKRRKSVENDILSQSQRQLVSTLVTYVPTVIQNDTGQVRFGMKSCTLVPNIFDLDEQTSLLDMAGYGDSRDYVGTLGVSYSLRAIFETLEEVKFIVVVTEAYLKNFKSLSDTLNHFFGMFDLQKYPDIEQRIFDATSLLITQSVDQTTYYNLINEARYQLNDPQLKNIDNRELIADFLFYIGKEVNRFREFKMARLGEPPEECDILQEFDKKGWKYMSLKATREQVMKHPEDPDIIKLPFQKQFLSMKPTDQQTLLACIDKRLQSYRSFSRILAKLYEQIFVEGSINDIQLPYCSFFADIKAFVTQNDHYDSEKYINSSNLLVEQFIEPQKQTLFYLLLKIDKILNFDDVVLGVSKQLLQNTMDIFRARITELVQLVSVIFCRNVNDYKLMLQLRFILLRGIREFYMLLHIAHQRVPNCVHDIRDYFQNIFPPDYEEYWKKFLMSFELDQSARIGFGTKKQETYMERYLQTRENAFAMEILFKNHEHEIMSLKGLLIERYYKILRDVKLIHARHQFQNCQYRKCLIYLHEAITLQINFQKNCITRLQDGLNEKTQDGLKKMMIASQLEVLKCQKKEIYINQENIFQMLKQVYIKMNRLQTALIISEKLNWVHSACEIYELMLAEKGNQDNQALIKNYAEYCMNHGLPEKGRALFHRLLELQRNIQSKKGILKMIRQSVEKPVKLYEEYLKFLTYYFYLNYQKQEELLEIIRQSLKEEDGPNIDRVVEIIEHQLNSHTDQEDIQQQQIFTKCLQQRDQIQASCEVYGFWVSYDELVENIPTFVIGNSEELQNLDMWLIKHFQTVSKLTNHSIKGKMLRIQVKQIDQLHISEKLIMITLNDQKIKSTFEYVARLIEGIKKLVQQQYDSLKMVIKFVYGSVQETLSQIKKDLRGQWQQSITNKEILTIKSLIEKMSKADDQGIESQYRKLYKQSKVGRSEMIGIIKYVRRKIRKQMYGGIDRIPEPTLRKKFETWKIEKGYNS